MIKQSILKPLLIATSLLTHCLASSEPITIPMNADRWEIDNDVQFVEYEGRQSIHLQGSFRNSPSAQLKDFQLANGIIEFDVSINHVNSIFPGLDFRISDDNSTFERIYFRPQNNQQINAFQYHPVYRHVHVWQLYGQHQRDLTLPDQEWFHVKVEIEGTRMACYLDDQRHPFFWTDRLQSGSFNGRIRFAGAGDYHIANLNITKHNTNKTEAFDPTAKDLPATYLKTWSVSPLLSLDKDAISVQPEQFHELSDNWKTLHAEDHGLINFSRHLGHQAPQSAFLAITEINSKGPQTKKLDLAYSDRIDLYLNGELIFSGNNTFRHSDSKMRSRVHLGNDTIELPLKDGPNQLQAILYDRAGGCALTAKLKNAKDLQL